MMYYGQFMLFFAIVLWFIGIVKFVNGAKYGFVFSEHGKHIFALCWIVGAILGGIGILSIGSLAKSWLVALCLGLAVAGLPIRWLMQKLFLKEISEE
jgi:hypothetical protein